MIYTGNLPKRRIRMTRDLAKAVRYMASYDQAMTTIRCDFGGTSHNSIIRSETHFTGFAGGNCSAVLLSCGHYEVDETDDMLAAR